MDVLRIPEPMLFSDGNRWRPDMLVEGYTSMIWKERYLDFGEFEMKSPDIDRMMIRLPLRSLITLRDRSEVMMVESHEIDRDPDGSMELTIKGRSLASLLSVRTLHTPPGDRYKMIHNYSNLNAALVYIWNSLVNETEYDAQYGQNVLPLLERVYQGGVRIPEVRVPSSYVTDSTTAPLTADIEQWVAKGEAWPTIQDFLKADNYGFRVVRPYSLFSKDVPNVFTVNPYDGESKGLIAKTPTANATYLQWDVYNGTDRSIDQNVVTPVIFDARAGHFEDTKYLFSIRDDRNYAYSYWSDGDMQLRESGTSETNPKEWGIHARQIALDAGGPAEGQPISEFTDSVINLTKKELAARNTIAIFDGTLANNNPYKFTKDFFLGDIVTFVGAYDVTQNMRINEYLRTQDLEGEREYPGFYAIS